jgi:heat shock factor-binding protein 1
MADEGGAVPENAQDLTIFVQNLLEQMQNRFNQMSTSIIGRIDEMGNRIDDLEKSITELMNQAGMDASKLPQDDEGKA